MKMVEIYWKWRISDQAESDKSYYFIFNSKCDKFSAPFWVVEKRFTAFMIAWNNYGIGKVDDQVEVDNSLLYFVRYEWK